MTRRSFVSMLIALVASTAASFIAGTESASAQNNPNICFYTVDVQGVPPNCFPITLTTEWNCGGMIKIDTRIVNAIGVVAFPLNPGGFPPCPPACKFNWASLNGPINPTPLNGSTRYVIGNCCYILSTTLDAVGGVYIRILGC